MRRFEEKVEWRTPINEHINLIDGKILVTIVRDKSPMGKRSTRRPRKKWSDNITIDKDKYEEGIGNMLIQTEGGEENYSPQKDK